MSVDEGLLRDVVETIPTEIAVLDSSGVILYTNAAWQQFARENGFEENPSSVGVNYLDVVDSADDEYADTAAEGLRVVLSDDGDDLFSFEYPCHSPDERRWFLMYARGFELDGERYAHVGHMDITDRKEAELGVREKNARLETVAYILRHDIRNPLSVALGYLDVLTEMVDGHADTIGRIRDALERIEDILSDASVVAHQPSLDDLDVVSLSTASETAWGNVETEDATLAVVESFEFEADRTVLGNLLENLFRNAVSHAGPDVTVTVGRLDDGGGFYVADDGPGIPEFQHDIAFTAEFTTGDAADHAGLGLVIVAGIADAHDWDVTLTESDTGGARFEFRGVTPAQTS